VPKKVRLIISYRQDASFLSRLAESIEQENKPKPWKKEVLQHLNALILLFLEQEKE